MSLRFRLLLALVSLVFVGLLVADAVTYASLRSFLYERVDQQLIDARYPVARAMIDAGAPLSASQLSIPAGQVPTVPPGTFGEILDAAGNVIGAPVAFTYGGHNPAPALPVSVARELGSEGGQLLLSVGSVRDHTRYRALAFRPRGSDYILVVAIPLAEVARTLGHVLVIAVVVSLAVLVGIGLLGWYIVRRELRPLEDMAATAGAIAAGDLTRRVQPAERHTEVGRLGLALNAMLTQIEQAFARRRASEDALRRFLAQASHELRTPLASIRGYAELFRRGARDRPQDLELAMRRIEEEATRMGVMVEELLLLARLDEGRPLERAPVDLARVAADAVADARIADPARGIGLRTAAPVVVEGDEMRLRQVTANLMTNALRHAGPGASIDVAVRREDGWAELEVRDDGVGMAPEVAARVFEPFYSAANGADEGRHNVAQESATRHPGKTGMGLGLAIARSIVHAHHGTLTLDTAPGKGSRFTVRLPATRPVDEPLPS